MRKINVPTKIERPASARPEPAGDTPRPRLGLKYGVNAEAPARP